MCRSDGTSRARRGAREGAGAGREEQRNDRAAGIGHGGGGRRQHGRAGSRDGRARPEESPAGHAAALAHDSFHGRPVSWVAVTIITIGFIIGGFAMVPTPTWWLFWTAAGIAVVGLGIGALAKVTEDWY